MERFYQVSWQTRRLGKPYGSHAVKPVKTTSRPRVAVPNRVNVEHNNLPVLSAIMAPPSAHGAWKSEPATGRNGVNGHLRIRPYQNTDRATICRLCCATGFLGQDIGQIFQDRELFAELFTRAYLEHGPEWVFVAEKNNQVIGYLLGSVQPRFDLVLMQCGLRTTTKMLLRLAQGRYASHPRSRRFIRWLLTAGFWEQPRHPRHGAHLHMQVSREHQGRNVARKLWEAYEERIREAGVTSCYGAFFSCRQRHPEIAYSRYGFSVFDRHRTTLFEPEIHDPVEVVCVYKTL